MAEEQQSKINFKIDTIAENGDSATVGHFPFAEIIVGSGVGAQAVAGGVLVDTNDPDFYYIQLTDAPLPQSVLEIITKAGNCSSMVKIKFKNQKADCKIKVSKDTGLVVSIDNIEITGQADITKLITTKTYNTSFENKDGPITYTYK